MRAGIIGVLVTLMVLLLFNSFLLFEVNKEGHPQQATAVATNHNTTLQVVDVVIGIPTGPMFFHRRQLIRRTWLSAQRRRQISDKVTFEAFFFMGYDTTNSFNIAREAEEYGDIVILQDVPDEYRTIMEKARSMFRWVSTHFDYKYFVKIDDDSFANLEMLAELVESILPTTTMFVGGVLVRKNEILRAQGHRNAEMHLDADMTEFPVYPSGAGFFLTADLVKHIGFLSIPLLRLTNDDAGIGLILAPFNVTRTDLPHIHPWGLPHCLPRAFVVHYVFRSDPTGKYLKELYKNSTLGLPVCPFTE